MRQIRPAFVLFLNGTAELSQKLLAAGRRSLRRNATAAHKASDVAELLRKGTVMVVPA